MTEDEAKAAGYHMAGEHAAKKTAKAPAVAAKTGTAK